MTELTRWPNNWGQITIVTTLAYWCILLARLWRYDVIHIFSADHVMNANLGEDLWRRLFLLGLHPDLIAGDVLVLLAAQDGDHVEGRTPRQGDRHHLDGLGPRSSLGIIQQPRTSSILPGRLTWR